MAKTQEAMRRLEVIPTKPGAPSRPRVTEITRSVEADKGDRDKGAYERIAAEIRSETGTFSQSEYRAKGYKPGTVQSVFSALKNLGFIRPIGSEKGTYVLESVAQEIESDALRDEIARLKRENEALQKKLDRAQAVLA